MADALDVLEDLAKAHKFLSGAKDVLSSVDTVHKAFRTQPKDVEALKKLVGLSNKKYKALKKFFDATRKKVDAAVSAGFHDDIKDFTQRQKAVVEKAGKKATPDSDAVQKELTLYMKLLDKYNDKLLERINYMDMIKKKCDLNIKNYTLMQAIIEKTRTALKVVMVGIPDASNQAALELLTIELSGIPNDPQVIANAYGRLKRAADAHRTFMVKKQAKVEKTLNEVRRAKLQSVLKDVGGFLRKVGF